MHHPTVDSRSLWFCRWVPLGSLIVLAAFALSFAQESGSVERPRPLPKRRQVIPEAGSVERPRDIGGPPSRPKTKSEDPEAGPTEPTVRPEQPSVVVQPAPPTAQPQPVIQVHLLLPVLVFLFGIAAVGMVLYAVGVFNPAAALIRQKQIEILYEVILRMDDFLVAAREKKFEKCQMALDALNYLNGRRAILLSNDVNSAVNEFVATAVDVAARADDDAFFPDLERRYSASVEAIRKGVRQGDLAEAVVKGLPDAHGKHRTLRVVNPE